MIQIDARVSRLLKPVFTPPQDIPYYTTSLEATLVEIRRRGWFKTIDDTNFQVVVDIWEVDKGRLSQFNLLAHVVRDDQNDALAALEALVRAVDGRA